MHAACVVVGIDGSEHGWVAARWAAPLAERLGATLVCVHARGLLERSGAAPEDHFERPHELVVEDGDPVGVLMRVADARDAAVIVVGRRGTGTNPALLLGSTSHQLAERAARPVIIVPPEESAA